MDCFVIVESIVKYKFNCIIKAIDVCFKLFLVTNADYPVQSAPVWYFLQRGVYDIDSGFDDVPPDVLALVNRLKKSAEKTAIGS